ncbi:MAG: TraB family, partial [Deltaproteobacteria bacterium]|nr:TraB family [Deltaproteobacteria bacterium]
GSYFVIVGAGHLVGKRGIVELLKNKGYGVEQL